MKTTAIIPVSRVQYLDRVLECLQNQTYKPNNLLIIFDGYDSQFLFVRNKIVNLEYENVLCVPSLNQNAAFSISDRREHIVSIHNQARGLIGDCDYVFSIEDDGIFPPDALEKFVNRLNALGPLKHDIGMITGVELGRWGTPYVGAWNVDDIYNPTTATSLENKTLEGGAEELDGCGLYCSLIRADMYKSHNFYTKNGLGPDINLGLYLRQKGLTNYIDWSIHVTHLTFERGQEIEIPANGKSHVVKLTLLSGSTWQATAP